MKHLYDEICFRFPEVKTDFLREGDKNLSYVVMGDVASWLAMLGPEALVPELVQRVVDFSDWCCDQPQGETSEDDIFTVWMIAFVEELFGSETGRALLTKLFLKGDLIFNQEYYIAWVGAENFQRTLDLY